MTPVDGTADVLVGPRSARPDRRVDVLLLLATTSAAALVYVVALLLDVLPPAELSVAFFAAVPICAFFAMMVLESRARAVGDVRLAWVSAGLAVGVVAMVLQLVSFPAVASGGGALRTSDDASATLYLMFHASLAAGAGAGALGAPVRWRGTAVVVGCVAAVLVALDAIWLPELVRAGTFFTPLLIAVEVILAVLVAGATFVWVLRAGRSVSAVYGWIAVALSLSVYDVVLNALGGERFAPVWWGSLSLRVATYLVLAVGALVAVLRQLRDAESYSERELARRETQLRSSLVVTAELLSSAEDFSRAVTSAEVADQLSAKACAVSGAPHASVVIGRAGAPLQLLGAHGYTAQMRVEVAQIDWDQFLPAPRVAESEEPLFLEDGEALQAMFPMLAHLPMRHAHALAALPVKIGGDVIGVLSVWDTKPTSWTQNQRRVLAGLAAQGGQAIARARAYEAQADAARTLQASLLPPRLPEPDRLDLAARYLPAQDGTLVGGDWYDCLVLDEDRVALVVGDVMGKGLRAAAQMGQIRMAVRSVAGLDPSPSAVLSALDDLNLELGGDEIVTMAYVLVDLRLGVAHVARAGHLPPLLVRPDGVVETIVEGGSPPLGAAFGHPRPQARFTLPRGALLVLYTDGLVEDAATGLDSGIPQLAAALTTAAPSGQPIGVLATRLLRECGSGRGGDDIALLLARYR